MADLSIFLSKLDKAKSYGSYVAGCCPFHEDRSPSLLVYSDGWFICLACDKRGTHDTLLRKLEGLPVDRTLAYQTSRRELPSLPPMTGDREVFCDQAHVQLRENEGMGWYLKLRGIEDRIERARLGYHQGWYTFPIFDYNDSFRGMILRASPYVQQYTGLRYYIPMGQQPMMYCPDWNLFNSKDYLFVVYGMIDALVLSSLRLPVVTTTSGKLTFHPEWLDSARKPIIIVPDEGEQMTAFDLVTKLGWRGAVLRLPYDEQCKDPADYAQYGRRAELEKLLLKGVNNYVRS